MVMALCVNHINPFPEKLYNPHTHNVVRAIYCMMRLNIKYTAVSQIHKVGRHLLVFEG